MSQSIQGGALQEGRSELLSCRDRKPKGYRNTLRALATAVLVTRSSRGLRKLTKTLTTTLTTDSPVVTRDNPGTRKPRNHAASQRSG